MNKETIKSNLVKSSESGVYPKYLAKMFFDNIVKAYENEYTLDNMVFANQIYGGNSGFIFMKDADKKEFSDFYFVSMDGTVSRWFPGIDINDLINKD